MAFSSTGSASLLSEKLFTDCPARAPRLPFIPTPACAKTPRATDGAANAKLIPERNLCWGRDDKRIQDLSSRKSSRVDPAGDSCRRNWRPGYRHDSDEDFVVLIRRKIAEQFGAGDG